MFALMAVGCGATAFEIQVEIAKAADDTAAETRALVRTFRTDAMRTAARAVHEAGGTLAEAKAAAEARGAELQPLVDAQRLYAASAHAYVDELDLAQGDVDAEDVKDALRGVHQAYRELRELGASLGVAEVADLPATPAWLDELLSPGAEEGGAR